MGIDRIYHHFYKLFGGTEYFEENSYDNSLVKLGSEIIILDGNFILYDVIYELETDLNYLVKLILTIPHCLPDKRDKIINEIITYVNTSKLKFINQFILKAFEQENIEITLSKLKDLFNLKNNNNIYDKIVGNYFLDYIKTKVLGLHYQEFLKEFYLVFDGIPSMPKVIEQKRRKLKNFVESTIRKLNIEEQFKNMPNFLYQDDKGNYFDYSLFIKYKISLSKSFGPTSNIFKYLEEILKDNNNNNNNFKLFINNTNKYEEADYKIYNLIKNLENKSITIHCSDFDFIFNGLLLASSTNNKINMVRHFKDNFLYIFFPKLIINIVSKIGDYVGASLSNNIISDINLIITFFGNDYLPGLIELSFENNFMEICKIFYENIWVKNELVLEKQINKRKLFIIFEELNKKAKRFYLINYIKLCYVNGNSLSKIIPETITTLTELKNKILLPYSDNSYPVIYHKVNDKLSNILINSEVPFGLKVKKNYPNFDMNPFENLYNHQVFLSQKLLTHKFKTLNNKLMFKKNLDEVEEENNYLKQISLTPTEPKEIVNKYLQVLDTYFSKFNDKNINKIHYNFYLAPKIEWIYHYFNHQTSEIEIIKTQNYFDSILHLIFISPHQNLEETEDNWIINFIETNKEYFLILDKNQDITIEILAEQIKKLNYCQVDIINLIEKWKIYLTNINYQYYKSHAPLIETNFITSLIKSDF